MDKLIALAEWAEKHGIGGARARRMAETGRIDAQLVCGRWTIDRDHPDPGPTPRGRPAKGDEE